jgi:hypothetical protein
VGRPITARNSNGLDRPKIQTIRAFLGLSRTGRPECTPIVCGPNFFANWPFSGFFLTIMPLTVSFQKMDPMLGAIIISAELLCAGANIIGVHTSDGGVTWDLRGMYLGAIDLGAEGGARSTTTTSAPRSMAPRYMPINRTLRLTGCCAHSNSLKLEISA